MFLLRTIRAIFQFVGVVAMFYVKNSNILWR